MACPDPPARRSRRPSPISVLFPSVIAKQGVLDLSDGEAYSIDPLSNNMKPHDPMLQRRELAEQRRKVDFDTYDVTIDELVRRVGKGRIEIAPVYQRQFRWGNDRQSRLVESLMLGIPVPPLFMATNLTPDERSQWEIVDGLQRLLTLVNFIGDEEAREVARLPGGSLKLEQMDKLSSLNGMRFRDLPEDIQATIEDRPVKVVVLNDKSDLQVRFDLFERLNTGGIRLTDHEVRECVFRGQFIDMLAPLTASDDFRTVIKLSSANWKDGTPEDYVLRFFAFLDNYGSFVHSVKEFLNEFTRGAVIDPKVDERKKEFISTFTYLAEVFPNGLVTRKGSTPVNLFEGVAVGAALALRLRPNLSVPDSLDWIKSDELKKMTTGATNSRARVKGRVEYCRDKFLSQ